MRVADPVGDLLGGEPGRVGQFGDELAGLVLPSEQAGQLAEAVLGLHRLPDLRVLLPLLRAAPGGAGRMR